MNRSLFIKIFQEILLWGVALVAAVYLVINIFPAFSAATIVGDGILVYATTTISTLQYRTYASSTNAFSDPAANAGSDISTTIKFVASAASPTSTEQIIGVEDGTSLTIMRWSGTTWVTDWTAPLALTTVKNFDIAYYGNAGSAMVIYATSTTQSAFSYRTWDGSSWSATGTLNFAIASSPGWVEMAGFAISTTTPWLVMGYNDAAGRFGFAIWNGSAWQAASTTGTGLVTNIPGDRQFDVAFETASGDALIAFGYQTETNIQSKSCASNAGGCATWSHVGVTAVTDQVDFISFAASPQATSNDIAAALSCAINTTGDDQIGGAIWTGASWAVVTGNIDAANNSCDNVSQGGFPAAVGWLGTSDVAVILYNDGTNAPGAATIDWATCTSGCSGWTGQTDITTNTSCLPASPRNMKITPWPNQNSAMLTYITNTGVLCNFVLTQSGATSVNDSSPGGAEGYVQGINAAAFAFNNVVSPTFSQRDFRWYENDANSANPSTAWNGGALAENADITQSDSPPGTGTIVRLRISATSTAATISAGTSFKLQFQATASEDCKTGAWTDVGAATTWALVDNAGVADGATITRSLTASTVNENYNESNPSLGMPNILSINSIGEFDWPIKNNGAAAGTAYAFRLAESDGTDFSSFANCPNITTAASVGPNTEQVLRHGAWFNAGVEQSFFW